MVREVFSAIEDRTGVIGRRSSGPRTNSWSRREDLNAPSADYDSAALTLSYTGSFDCLRLYHFARAPTPSAITLWGRIPRSPRWSFSFMHSIPHLVKGT